MATIVLTTEDKGEGDAGKRVQKKKKKKEERKRKHRPFFRQLLWKWTALCWRANRDVSDAHVNPCNSAVTLLRLSKVAAKARAKKKKEASPFSSRWFSFGPQSGRCHLFPVDEPFQTTKEIYTGNRPIDVNIKCSLPFQTKRIYLSFERIR